MRKIKGSNHFKHNSSVEVQFSAAMFLCNAGLEFGVPWQGFLMHNKMTGKQKGPYRTYRYGPFVEMAGVENSLF